LTPLNVIASTQQFELLGDEQAGWEVYTMAGIQQQMILCWLVDWWHVKSAIKLI